MAGFQLRFRFREAPGKQCARISLFPAELCSLNLAHYFDVPIWAH
jgi:hypothetical protein